MRDYAPALMLGAVAVALAGVAAHFWKTLPSVSYVLGMASMWAFVFALSLAMARPWRSTDRVLPKK